MSLFARVGYSCAMAVVLSMMPALPASAQTRAYVGNFKDQSVSVVDTGRGQVVATVPVGPGPHGMAVSIDGRQVFVGADAGSTVSVIDTVSDRVTAEIEVGQSPHGLVMSPDGRVLLVGVYGEDRVAWVDVATRQVSQRVEVAKPHTLAVHPDGHRAYVASQQPGDFALVVLDLDRRAVARRIPLARPPRDLEFGMEGRFLYFTLAGEDAVQVLDPRDDRVVATIATGPSPHVAKVAAGSTVGLVVVQGTNALMRFDAATSQPGAAIPVGRQPHWMSFYDQGAAVAVTNEGSDSLSLVDLATGKVRTVDVGRGPRKVVTVELSSAARAAAAVTIRNFAFAPAVLTVRAGSTVTWRNDDGSPHGVATADRGVSSDVLLPGEQYAQTFPDPGTFDYVCSVHPYMAGRVVVVPH